MDEKKLALVYMVAGMSSRFGGKIKQFAKVGPNDEELIKYSINQAYPSGFDKIVFIVGEKTEKPFKEMFGWQINHTPIQYALQSYNPEERDRPWGTVDALLSAKKQIDCPFVVCNGDDLYGENTFKMLANHLKKSDECATVGYKLGAVLPDAGNVTRGIFKKSMDSYVKKIVETSNISRQNLKDIGLNLNDLCSMNIFGLQPEVLGMLEERLEMFKSQYKGERKAECLLPTEISSLIEKDKIKMKICTSTDKWYGVTNPEDEEAVRKYIAKSIL